MNRWIAVRSATARVNPLVTDGLVAVVATALSVAEIQEYPSPRDRSGLNVALVLVQTGALLFRRRFPSTVFAIGAVSLAIEGSLNLQSPFFAFLAVNIALYSLAAYGHQRRAVVGASVWGLLLTIRLFYVVGTTPRGGAIAEVFDVIDDYALAGAAWILGQGVRSRRLHAAELEGRAARLEVEREEKARQAATQERLRIARELHDVVAHSLSVIGVQAGAARLVLDAEPGRAREAVAAIEATANRAMAEMRRALGILRDTERSGATLAPPPGLQELPSLLDQIRMAGLPVDLTMRGAPRALPTSIDLSLYRIVQEALTNALKHARASHADVVVTYGDDDVEIEVVDDGRGSSSWDGASEGAGTIGMRERVALFGGDLWVGPRSGGGYSVRVRLPLSGEQP